MHIREKKSAYDSNIKKKKKRRRIKSSSSSNFCEGLPINFIKGVPFAEKKKLIRRKLQA